jgi:hypothetical protein
MAYISKVAHISSSQSGGWAMSIKNRGLRSLEALSSVTKEAVTPLNGKLHVLSATP